MTSEDFIRRRRIKNFALLAVLAGLALLFYVVTMVRIEQQL
jgi:hypothetical protein